jgi:hypothetical protein
MLTNVLMARANQGGSTKQTLSFAGTLRQNGQPIVVATPLLFTFKKGGVAVCTPPSTSPIPNSQGGFTTDIDISKAAGCPDDLFDGSDIDVVISVNGQMLPGQFPVNPVPYAKYADKAARTIYLNPSGPVGKNAYSVGGGLCGLTPPYNGAQVNGYAGAKSFCQDVIGCSPTAHMCSGEELVRSSATGKKLPAGTVTPLYAWYASSLYTIVNTAGQIESDCGGFSASDGSTNGAAWYWPTATSTGVPNGIACSSTTTPIACCD